MNDMIDPVMTEMPEDLMEHSTECCRLHGCAYGELDCPVETGMEPQEGPCEDCPLDSEVEAARQVLSASFMADEEDLEDAERILQEREWLTRHQRHLERGTWRPVHH